MQTQASAVKVPSFARPTIHPELLPTTSVQHKDVSLPEIQQNQSIVTEHYSGSKCVSSITYFTNFLPHFVFQKWDFLFSF